MNESDDSSDINELLSDPNFQAEVKSACIKAIKGNADPTYDWEDLQHDVFVLFRKRFKSIVEYRRITYEKRYLYKIARNHLIDRRKSPKNPPQGKIVDVDEISTLIDERAPGEIYHELSILKGEILALLRPSERPIVEAYFNGEPWTEIAERLGITPKTAASRFTKIMKSLNRHLKNKRRG